MFVDDDLKEIMLAVADAVNVINSTKIKSLFLSTVANTSLLLRKSYKSRNPRDYHSWTVCLLGNHCHVLDRRSIKQHTDQLTTSSV